MSRRPFLVAMLRSWGPWVVVPLVVLEVLGVRDAVPPLVQDPRSVMDAVNGVLIVVDPLVAGLTCAEALALGRGVRRDLVGVLPDSGIRLVATQTLATTLWVVVVHAVTVAGAIGYAVVDDPASVPSLWPMVPALLSVVAYGAVGAALGRLWPRLVAPPLVAVGLYLVALLVERNFPDPLVEFGGATTELLGLRHRPEVLAGQAGWLLVVAAAGVVVATASWRGYARLDRRGMASLAVVAVAALGLGSLGDLRFEDAPVTDWACAGHDPQVCVLPEYADRLAAERHLIGGIAAQLERLDAPVPSRFEQAVRSPRDSLPDVGTFSIYRNKQEGGDYYNQVLGVVQSLACPRGDSRLGRLDTVTRWATRTHRNPEFVGTPAEKMLRTKARRAARAITSCG